MMTEKPSEVPDQSEYVAVVTAGHVDHGKSTIIGRLLADTGSLPDGKLEQVARNCRQNAKPFEYAFLLDALKDEQSQGVTIEAARCFMSTEQRNYIIIDAPGHIEFLKNMITGAARAEAALLIVDAREGIQENSRRHGYLLAMLGIQQVAVLVNKMDLVDYQPDSFYQVVQQFRGFLHDIQLEPLWYIPVSGSFGDNIAGRSSRMLWYDGPTVLEALDLFRASPPLEIQPFRMPVQDVYKFTAGGDQRRIVAGVVENGAISRGDAIRFWPSGKHTRIRTIEGFNQPVIDRISAGFATGFTLEDPIYVTRGEVACRDDEPPMLTARRFRANLFWLGRTPLQSDKKYLLKMCTAKTGLVLEKVLRVMDAAMLEPRDKTCVERNEVAECILTVDRRIAFDLPHQSLTTSRFVIVDNYEITGGGIIQESLPDVQTQSWEASEVTDGICRAGAITPEERRRRNGHRAALVILAGGQPEQRLSLARNMEATWFHQGMSVFHLDVEEKHSPAVDQRAITWLLKAGMVVLATCNDTVDSFLNAFPCNDDQTLLTVHLGETAGTDCEYMLVLSDIEGGPAVIMECLVTIGVLDPGSPGGS